jgi:hypothetical protein
MSINLKYTRIISNILNKYNISTDHLPMIYEFMGEVYNPNKYEIEKEVDMTDLLKQACADNNIPILTRIHEITNKRLLPRTNNLCTYAVINGNYDVLKWLLDNDNTPNTRVCSNSAKYNQYDCLQLLHQNGYIWNEFTTSYAAMSGSLKCLEYAHTHGCKWNAFTSSYAAENGNINCLRYACLNNCPINQHALLGAIKNGYIECIELILDNYQRFSISLEMINIAIEYNQLKCLLFLINHPTNNVVIDEGVYNIAIISGDVKMIQYLDTLNLQNINIDSLFKKALHNNNYELIEYYINSYDMKITDDLLNSYINNNPTIDQLNKLLDKYNSTLTDNNMYSAIHTLNTNMVKLFHISMKFKYDLRKCFNIINQVRTNNILSIEQKDEICKLSNYLCGTL